jgi:hypothetical protein
LAAFQVLSLDTAVTVTLKITATGLPTATTSTATPDAIAANNIILVTVLDTDGAVHFLDGATMS